MTEDSDEGAGRSSPAEESACKVGYGKPPRHSRFKPGRSGNPRGRPKGAVGCKTILERVVLARHTVIEQGKRQQRTILDSSCWRCAIVQSMATPRPFLSSTTCSRGTGRKTPT